MQLQKAGKGILGAFGLKVTGNNPPLFGDAVVPVADVFDQYLADAELQVNNQVLATNLAAFNSSTFTVPNGKCWRLIGASLVGQLNAADAAITTQSTVNIQSPNSAPNGCRVATSTSYATPGPRIVAAAFRPPIFLPSGFKVVLELWGSAAITISSNLQATAFYQEFDL
jgi:hypothetical protein